MNSFLLSSAIRSNDVLKAQAGDELPGPTMNPFTWVSVDPTSGELVPYDAWNARYLEVAYRHGQEELSLLLPIAEAGFVVTVHVDHENGLHVQRSSNGTGERTVRRVDGNVGSLEIDGVTHAVPSEWAIHFRRISWVHLDPVTGVIAPYSKENADVAERALRQRERFASLQIVLPTGAILGAHLNVDVGATGKLHNQTTGVGFREVARLELPFDSNEATVAVYRTPKEANGYSLGVDAERYRLSDNRGENAFINVQSVPFALGCYMEEEALPLAAFAPMSDIERSLKQLGYGEVALKAIARQLKTGPHVEAMKKLSALYSVAGAQGAAPLADHLREITAMWMEQGFVPRGEGIWAHRTPLNYRPDELLLDNPQKIYDDGHLIATQCRSYGSNLMKVAAAAVYLLMNPDCQADEEEDDAGENEATPVAAVPAAPAAPPPTTANNGEQSGDNQGAADAEAEPATEGTPEAPADAAEIGEMSLVAGAWLGPAEAVPAVEVA